MVKVDVDPVASYAGDVEGYAATSPEITGVVHRRWQCGHRRSTRRTCRTTIAAAQAEAAALIPSAKMLSTYATVYGGFAMTIPANRAKDLLSLAQCRRRPEQRTASALRTGHSRAIRTRPGAQPRSQATPMRRRPSSRRMRARMPCRRRAAAHDARARRRLHDLHRRGQGVGRASAAATRPVRASSSASSTPASGPSTRCSPTTASPKPAGGPWACEFGDGGDRRGVHLQRQAHRRLRVPRHLPGHRRAAGAEDYCVASAVLRARLRGPRHPHRDDRGRQLRRVGADLRRRPRSDQRHRSRSLGDRVPGPRPRTAATTADLVAAISQAVDRRRRRHQLLDQRQRDPYDPVELAFLDAFAAGITVNASAGNAGPDASTADHASPWTTTVGGIHLRSRLHLGAHPRLERRRDASSSRARRSPTA